MYAKSRKNLWIIEDDEASAELIETTLKHAYHTKHFADAESCIRALSTERLDILVLDMILPGELGSDVLRIFKAVDQTIRIPIVVVSAVASPDVIEEAIKDGASAYITKPFNVGNLIDTISAAELQGT